MQFSNTPSFDLNTFLKNVSTHPGVYRMYDHSGQILYIGKAKNLKKRINHYFNKSAKDAKTQKLIARVSSIEVTLTPSDYEAYLLESVLIKKHKPRYNVLFKDDKSYPYLALSDHRFPRLYGYRGRLKKNVKYFGPYVSLSSMRSALVLLQKLFPIRQCEDSYFNARTRPCLQYQINRCSAPCVGKISETDYTLQTKLLTRFIEGKFACVLAKVSEKMHQASDSEDYEKAATLRDQLILLTKLQQQQMVDQSSLRHFHVIGLAVEGNQVGIALLEIHAGKIQHDRYWLTDRDTAQNPGFVLDAFLSHYYLADSARNIWPKQVILPKAFTVSSELLSAISKKAGMKIEWKQKTGGINLKWQKLASVNAGQKLKSAFASSVQFKQRFSALKDWLTLAVLKRIECFDVSHHQGEETVASCVVYEVSGPLKSAYRRYNIQGITAGDDYAAMAQALERRIHSGIEAGNLPELIIIDGGLGQLHKAEQVIVSYQLQSQIQLLALSKGEGRISGQESIYKGFDDRPYTLNEYDPAFLLLREIRDSAHEFAIKSQRKKMRRRQSRSVIEDIPQIGAKRRKALLMHFGGWQQLGAASVDEIAKVPGISHRLAGEIWHAFR